ncbi:MAG: site-specific DNA-methyltransferase [Candidatus Methanoperedens sp.]|nr:site-specific DNA-methyltransferase [Candidatus Methanoperedens sp.]
MEKNLFDFGTDIKISSENPTEKSETVVSEKLSEIDSLDFKLSQHFHDKFIVQRSLTRQLVSFQANKTMTSYRWYKYKEAFSAPLVEYLLARYGIVSGKVLDPFAGSGTTLFAASALGMDVDGIELLPIGQQIIAARLCLEREFTADDFAAVKQWLETCPWKQSQVRYPLPKLRITDGAYSIETSDAIERYVGALQQENERVRLILRFALLCILESISYTRKDGQYLRWDYRSGRRRGGKPFHKGDIFNFDQAICAKIGEILQDLKLSGGRLEERIQGNIHLFQGSCLDVMPQLPCDSYDAIVTSPPYCNRYDYTRTYALELALLGVSENELLDLRQQMLSCTVENRAKDLLAINPQWANAVEAADRQELLQAILRYLEDKKAQGKLNNSGIPRMVRGYIYEMACIIAECSRVMKQNAYLFMVNDNVRYAGASVSVDMILSSIAENLGLHVENVLVLPNGKGNSSQQMGEHGRDPLRKCVYVWRKA